MHAQPPLAVPACGVGHGWQLVRGGRIRKTKVKHGDDAGGVTAQHTTVMYPML
jgi:hypothetical protein